MMKKFIYKWKNAQLHQGFSTWFRYTRSCQLREKNRQINQLYAKQSNFQQESLKYKTMAEKVQSKFEASQRYVENKNQVDERTIKSLNDKLSDLRVQNHELSQKHESVVALN